MASFKEWADGAPLAELAALVAVLEQGSFTRAARKMARDATVVSRRVRSLEDRLGVRLLERSTRRIAATDAGADLAARARTILEELTEAESEATAHAHEKPRGTLRVSLPATFGRMWIAPHLPLFLAANPNLTLDADFSNRFVNLMEERFDLAVRLGGLADSGLVARRLAGQRRLLCASPQYLAKKSTPRAPRDLAGHACLAFTGLVSHPVWNLVNGKGARARVRVSGPLVTNDPEAIRAAALQGAGIMLCHDWFADRELARGRLVHILSDWTTDERSAIHLVIPSGRFVPPKTRVFGDFLDELFKTQPWRANSPKTRKKG